MPPRDDDTRDVLSRLVGRRCEANVELEGSDTRCLLYSGSQVSTVSASHYNNHLAGKITLRPVASLLTIEAANGLPIIYLGYVQVSIDMGVYRDDMQRQK